MAPTVGDATPRRDYRRGAPVTPERWLARQLGRTEAGVHQLLYAPFRCGLTLPDLTALAVTAFAETDALDRLARWAAPVRSALSAVKTLPLSPEMIREAQEIDLAEDMVECEYYATPTAAVARKWVAIIDRCVGSLLALRTSLVEKHQLEDR